MKILKTFLLILLSAMFLTFSFMYISILGIERTLLNQDYYEGLVYEVDVFADVHENLIGIFPEQTETADSNEFETLVTETLIDTISKNWLEEQFLNITKDLLGYIKGDNEDITASIDLKPQKKLLVDNLIEELQNTDKVHDELPELQPEVIASDITEESDLPDEIYLNEVLEEPLTAIEAEIDTVRTARDYFHIGSYVFFGIMLLLMCLLAGISSGLKCYGINMIVPGVAYAGSFFLFKNIIDISTFNISEDIPITSQTIFAIFEYTINHFIEIGVVYATIGILITLLGFLLGKKKRKREN